MILSTHDDPSAAADFLLSDLEADLSLLGNLLAANPTVADHYRVRLVDAACDITNIARTNLPRTNR